MAAIWILDLHCSLLRAGHSICSELICGKYPIARVIDIIVHVGDDLGEVGM